METPQLEFINIKECAVILGVEEATIKSYVKNRTIPHYKFQGNVRFLKSEIIKLILDGKRE